jgi:hypothetical protein
VSDPIWAWEDHDPRWKYRLCGAGFALTALALGLLGLSGGLDLVMMFTGDPAVGGLVRHPLWTWLVGAPITWGSLIGSYLLWGRWREPRWQRRAGLLVLMNATDLLFWILDHGDDLGLGFGRVGHGWLRMHISMALGWAELALFAGLAGDFSAHLGKREAPDAARAARSFSGVGAVVWLFWFLKHTNWIHWPLVSRRFIGLNTYLLMAGTTLLQALTALQVTLLCVLASRQAGQIVRELTAKANSADPLRSRSEADADLLWEHSRSDS